MNHYVVDGKALYIKKSINGSKDSSCMGRKNMKHWRKEKQRREMTGSSPVAVQHAVHSSGKVGEKREFAHLTEVLELAEASKKATSVSFLYVLFGALEMTRKQWNWTHLSLVLHILGPYPWGREHSHLNTRIKWEKFKDAADKANNFDTLLNTFSSWTKDIYSSVVVTSLTWFLMDFPIN